MLLFGLLLVAVTGAFTGLLIADNLSGGPEYQVAVVGHDLVVLNSLGIFLAGLALALLFCLGLVLARAGRSAHRAGAAEVAGAAGTTGHGYRAAPAPDRPDPRDLHERDSDERDVHERDVHERDVHERDVHERDPHERPEERLMERRIADDRIADEPASRGPVAVAPVAAGGPVAEPEGERAEERAEERDGRFGGSPEESSGGDRRQPHLPGH
ncbi:hypothetical protein OG715_02855 [Kitasatospora purpeofusca]|uniref:hypothetical protein n=1 Tax=Kitasatospora purpeofusca TaxID=67352 RepID=UPI002E15CB3C|nr:hypothetical protein OG715_02855 [Kitasatospora purpeofusca]